MGLRILTVAWMQKESLLSIVSENWTPIFKSGKLKSFFKVQKLSNALHGTLGKKFSKAMPQSLFKARLDTSGQDFWPSWNFETFFENIPRLDPPCISGKKFFFPKKAPKHVWTLGNDFEQFWNFEFLLIFCLNFFNVSTSNFKSGKPNSIFLSPEKWPHIFKSRKSEKPCMEHWAKKFGKIALKHVQNTFGHFWKRLWSVLEFWNFFDYFENFRKTDPPWNTGQNFVSRKLPQNMFKTSWTILATILGISAILKCLWFFQKLSMTPWNSGQKNIFKKIAPKHVWTLGNVFGHFRNFEIFLIFSFNFF